MQSGTVDDIFSSSHLHINHPLTPPSSMVDCRVLLTLLLLTPPATIVSAVKTLSSPRDHVVIIIVPGAPPPTILPSFGFAPPPNCRFFADFVVSGRHPVAYVGRLPPSRPSSSSSSPLSSRCCQVSQSIARSPSTTAPPVFCCCLLDWWSCVRTGNWYLVSISFLLLWDAFALRS